MNKKEFDELVEINKALGNKYDGIVKEVGGALGIANIIKDDFIGFEKFKFELEKSFNTWEEEINSNMLDGLDVTKYGTCGIENIKTLKNTIETRFGKNNWEYLIAIGNKFSNVISINISYDKLKSTWIKLIKEEISNLGKLNKNSNEGGEHERWKLTSKKMEALSIISFKKIIPIDILNHEDVLFVEQFPNFEKNIKEWCRETETSLNKISSDKLTWKVIPKKLEKYKSVITASENASLIKNKIISLVESSVSDTPTSLFNIIEKIKPEFLAIHDSIFIKDFFKSVILTKEDIEKFKLPIGLEKWISDSSVEKIIKEQLLDYYTSSIQKWIDEVKDGPNLFLTNLKDPNKYILDSNKLSKLLELIFGVEYEKNKPGLFIHKIIMLYLSTPQISLTTLDELWQNTILSKDLAPAVLKDAFENLYSSLKEEQWENFNLSLILPLKSELIFALKQSRWHAPQVKDEKEDEDESHPTPEPSPRKNPIVVFKNLKQQNFSLIISDSSGKKITDIYLPSSPNLYLLDISEMCQVGKKYLFSIIYQDKSTISNKNEVEIISTKEKLTILFAYKQNVQQIFSYNVPFMPTKVEVYGGNGKLIQTINEFRPANSFAFECLSRSSLSLDDSGFSGALDFYFKFLGEEITSDYWCSYKEYKTNDIPVLVEFKVTAGTYVILADFEGEPWDAYISSSKSEKDILKQTLVVLKGKTTFLIGKGIHGQASAYLHIRNNNKKIVVNKKINKPFSTDQWNVSLTVKNDSNLSIDYNVLELVARTKLNGWISDVLFSIANELNKKIDIKTAPKSNWPSTTIEILKSLSGGLAILGATGGTVAAVILQSVLSLINEGVSSQFWQPQSKEELISLLKKDIVDAFNTKFEENLTELINALVKSYPEIHSTAELEKVLIKDLKNTLPNPTELVKKISWE